ncbi:MAG: glycosyltransferase family 1 protein [Bacteroidota bacterium]
MRILYDHQIFSILKFGGISRYFAELYSGLSRDSSFHTEFAVRSTDNINYQKIVLNNTSVKHSPTNALLKKIRGKLFPTTKEGFVNRRISVEKLSRQEYDLFHPTYYDPYFLEYLRGKPYVLTVFDLIHELFPEYFTDTVISEMRERKKLLIKNAEHIIAISEQTKNDIISQYSVSSDKITTIYLASSFSKVTLQSPQSPTIPKNYLLFVGNRDIYKNFSFFIEAIADILRAKSDLYLICAGPEFIDTEKILFSQLKIENKVLQYFPSDNELIMLYQHAIALVYPSKYEGFGLPLLEAFACGCPVITSNASSLPEVGGDAVLYFDPENASEIQAQIKQLSTNEQLRNQQVDRGYDRLKMFSWDKTVEQTKSVYRKVLL